METRDTEGSVEIATAHKTMIVTGGSQGIGAGLVKAFLSRHYNVVANSRQISKSGAFEPSADAGNRDLLRRASELAELPESWRAYFRKRLWNPDELS